MPPRLPHHFITSAPARHAWRGLLVLLLVGVGYLAFTPVPPDGADFGWDKANHLLAFSALTVAACFGFPGTPCRVAGIAAVQLAFGALIELVQANLPGRAAEWNDLLADCAGIAIGCIVAGWTLHRLMAPARARRR